MFLCLVYAPEMMLMVEDAVYTIKDYALRAHEQATGLFDQVCKPSL